MTKQTRNITGNLSKYEWQNKRSITGNLNKYEWQNKRVT